ncbi:MAG: hypothetical protein U0164_02960 [Gemmatimonadaceae bacterium]
MRAHLPGGVLRVGPRRGTGERWRERRAGDHPSAGGHPPEQAATLDVGFRGGDSGAGT